MILCAALLLCAGLSEVSGAVKKEKKEKAIVTAVFVTDVDCAHCVDKILNNVPTLGRGIKDVQVDLQTKEVTVVYDASKNDERTIVEGLASLKVKAEPKAPEAPAPQARRGFRVRGLYPAAGSSLWGASRRCPAAGSGAVFVPCGGPGIDPAADQQTEQVQGEEERGDEDHAEQLRTPFGRQLREGNDGQFDAGQAPGPGPLGVPFGGEPTEACGDQRPEEGNPAGEQQGGFGPFAPAGLAADALHQPEGESLRKRGRGRLPERPADGIIVRFHRVLFLPSDTVSCGCGAGAPSRWPRSSR
jgi:mercuric ion binding protein